MRVVEGFRKTAPAAWAAKVIHPDSSVVGDGLACFRGIADAGIEPRAMVTGSGAPGIELPERSRINTILGNVKTAMQGTYHQASPQHLPRDLAQFCYRFNRRFDLAAGCRASGSRPRAPRPCPTACSSWLRLIGNQDAICTAAEESIRHKSPSGRGGNPSRSSAASRFIPRPALLLLEHTGVAGRRRRRPKVTSECPACFFQARCRRRRTERNRLE
jgi:hypothetical protein